jgi:hypothetical protein
MLPRFSLCLLGLTVIFRVRECRARPLLNAAAFAPPRVAERLSPSREFGLKPQSDVASKWNSRILSINPRVESTSLHLFRRTRQNSQQRASNDDNSSEEDASNGLSGDKKKGKIRKRVKDIARILVARPLALASTVPMPAAIASVLREASLAAVEQVEDVIHKNSLASGTQALEESKIMMSSIIDEAFLPMEASLVEMETLLAKAKISLQVAKYQSTQAIEAIQVAAIAQAEGAAAAVAQAEKVAERQVMADIYSNAMSDVDVSTLSFADVDYESSEMAPPFLDPDSCLVPGEPVVRVEKAPENSRRIFAGIDIMASVDDVWNVSVFCGHGVMGCDVCFRCSNHPTQTLLDPN